MDRKQQMIGGKSVKFSDFNIIPQKMGGKIIVRDDLDHVLGVSSIT